MVYIASPPIEVEQVEKSEQEDNAYSTQKADGEIDSHRLCS